MKTLLLNLVVIVTVFSTISCSSVNGKNEKKETASVKADKIEVYYFHYTRRCATCLAVEDETKAALEDLYSSEINNKKITFKSVNLDEPDSDELATKLEISGQTLLIVAGDKKENLTTDAFMNARSNPEKLKEIIKSTIDPLLGK